MDHVDPYDAAVIAEYLHTIRRRLKYNATAMFPFGNGTFKKADREISAWARESGYTFKPAAGGKPLSSHAFRSRLKAYALGEQVTSEEDAKWIARKIIEKTGMIINFPEDRREPPIHKQPKPKPRTDVPVEVILDVERLDKNDESNGHKDSVSIEEIISLADELKENAQIISDDELRSLVEKTELRVLRMLKERVKA